jgi:LDH2 family malate/lactate/ureidoglycolate dehydrogenase
MPSRVGHTFRMTNIEAFMPLDEFRSRMDFLIDEVKESPKAAGVEEILIPGELENRATASSGDLGISLSSETAAALEELSRKYGVPPVRFHAEAGSGSA